MIFLTDDEDKINGLLMESTKEDAIAFCRARGYDEKTTKKVVEEWVANERTYQNARRHDEILEERDRVMEKYEETFGEDSGMIYIEDINEAVEIYKHCLEVGKSYEEIYGEDNPDVLY